MAIATVPSATSLSTQQQAALNRLKSLDQQVRDHEQAHKSAGGPYAGSPSYEYVTGPDGRRYAVGGEVRIDTAPVRGNPAATIRKMDIVIRAALAPAQPSPQDQAAAVQAQAMRAEAEAELARGGGRGPATGPAQDNRVRDALAAYAKAARLKISGP